MILEFYKNMSEPSDLEKNLIDKVQVDGIIKSDFNILNPTIAIKAINVRNYNYCYIPDYMRYYYIIDSTISSNGLCVMKLKVDVLMSYRADIKASSGLITKQKLYNPYSGEHNIESRYTLQKLEFENVFNYDKGDYILVTMRGN